jgi:hypothetical protein
VEQRLPDAAQQRSPEHAAVTRTQDEQHRALVLDDLLKAGGWRPTGHDPRLGIEARELVACDRERLGGVVFELGPEIVGPEEAVRPILDRRHDGFGGEDLGQQAPEP